MAYIETVDLSIDSFGAIGGTNNKTGKPNPTKIEGYYLGSRSIKGNYGPKDVHIFKTKSGNIGINARGNMSRVLPAEYVGEMVLLEFVGMLKPSKPGKNPSYKYRTKHDPENRIELPNEGTVNIVDETSSDEESLENTDELSAEMYTNDSEADEEGLYEEESSEDVVVVARPKAPAAPAKATKQQALTVQEMLARRAALKVK